jgi:hypothetical protein
VKPKYDKECQAGCVNRQGNPRIGEVWVHMWGTTSWVCRTCATRMGHQIGQPDTEDDYVQELLEV